MQTYEIKIRGLVQGVGFRPFIYRIARQLKLTGEVGNTSGGVTVVCNCSPRILHRLTSDICRLAPPAAMVRSVEVRQLNINGYRDFRITASQGDDSLITDISPDIAVCDKCLTDLRTQAHRIDYPFINCTGCGPRFTIITGLPYDRAMTSMKPFDMCERCSAEYHDMDNRRFHAQPVACNFCGPSYRFRSTGEDITTFDEIMQRLTSFLSHGKIIAIKGQGGYHLMCDAFNDQAVVNLRTRKTRDKKPFAVMFRDLASVRKYCIVNHEEERILTSWRRPIVLLRQRNKFPEGINSGLSTIGAILPYMPVHYLLFQNISTEALVLTSGNLSEKPLIADDAEAEKELGPLADAVVDYNREIINRADDSVVSVVKGRTILHRRSRGFVPAPIDLNLNVDGILAVGAELKNTFCLGKGFQAIPGQHTGDLKEPETYRFFREALERMSSIYRFTPGVIACDLHPGYLSTQYAEEQSARLGIPLMRVQHHHAHIASCMAEFRLDSPVIGICLDGTGYGSDGNIWGGEFFTGSPGMFHRYTHFGYVPMPGGDKAASEPWRMAVAYVYSCLGRERISSILPLFPDEGDKITLLTEMMDKKINSPLSSGAGRLFDAVSALLGICHTHRFEAEGPMRLESCAARGVRACYPFQWNREISFAETIHAILDDLGRCDVSHISAKFHNTLVKVIEMVCNRIRSETGIQRVVLSGGVFQNRFLLGRSVAGLEGSGFQVYVNESVPVNDGGIALGQLWVTSKMIRLCV